MKRCVFFLAAWFAAVVVRAETPAVSASFWETNLLCIRASQVTTNFVAQLRASQPPGRLTGTVLDLRFADGGRGDADAAEKWFASKKTPLVILVNSQTRGAAAALVTRLRASLAAIVIGSTNPPGFISPDIAVAASLDDEKKFQENPFFKAAANRIAAVSATNNLLAFVDHTSEAELVRKRIKDGEEDGDATTPRAEPPQPVIRDPALARAVDLLKALAVLHQSRVG